MSHLWRARCAFLLSFAGTSGLLSAQTSVPTGVVGGSVADPSGARVPHATVHVQAIASAYTRDTVTDSVGRFSLTLPVGDYSLTISAPGFTPDVRRLSVLSASPTRIEVSLRIAVQQEAIAVPSADTASTASDDNASAITLQRQDLSKFSPDDATFQKQLLALAGGYGKAPSVFVNGFSGARIPPKSAIASVRINRNPYSAMYDNLGIGRVEIATRPGGEKLHGEFNINATDSPFNAQNPYITAEPPYYVLNLDGNLSGTFRKTAFVLNGVFNDQQNNAALDAVTLNAANQQVAYRQAVRDPQLTTTFGLRLDRRFSATNTSTGRYEFNQVALTNAGLTAPLTLASQAFNSGTTTQTLQLSDTQVFGAHIVYESHAQYVRTRLQQDAVDNTPTLLVEGGFNGGGNPGQSQHDNRDSFEFQQLLSVDRGPHYLRFGARYRLLRDANLSTANYNGQFVFPTLAALAARQPSQFSITTGSPSATVFTGDLGAYAEDEWKPAKTLTLDFGLRLESQSAVPDHLDLAPRFGAAWSIRRKGQAVPVVLIRGGAGAFYDRFSPTDLLTAVRQNGKTQQTYFLSNPTTYPQLPNTASLTAAAPAVYKVSPTLQSESGWAGGVSVEKFLGPGGKWGTASVNYVAVRGVHQYDSRNINAPLPGTYNPAVPTGGVRPFGGSQNIYEYDSNGIQKSQIVFFNSRLNLGKYFSAFLSYTIDVSHQDIIDANTFVSNSYDVSQDYGRSPQPTQRLFTGGTAQLPLAIALNLFISTQGGTPFNITTGTDLNGDSIYNDRPAFATAPTAASQIYTTRFGTFDANPQPGEKIIPFNYGNSPNLAYLDLSVTRAFHLGRRPSAPAAVAGKPAPPRPDAPYTLSFTLDASNAFNHRNQGQPVGVLSSPLFGQTVALNNPFGSVTAANRTVFLQTSFSF